MNITPEMLLKSQNKDTLLEFYVFKGVDFAGITYNPISGIYKLLVNDDVIVRSMSSAVICEEYNEYCNGWDNK